MPMNYEKILNQKNKFNIIHNEYIFNKENRKTVKSGWRCSNRKCSVKGSVDEGDIFIQSGTHNHSKDSKKIIKLRAVNYIKNESCNNNSKNYEIVTNFTKNLNEEGIKNLPKFKSMMDKCTRVRNKKFIVQSSFDDIPDFVKKDLQNNIFLQYDSGVTSEDRFCIFFSNFNRNFFSSVDTVLIDGTFWSVPVNFYQLVTFNFFIFGKYYPLIFVLMCDKSEKSYLKAFTMVKTLTKCCFKNVVVDFESALINAIEEVFFSSIIFGCGFHFGQNMWRKIQELGLAGEYLNNFETRNQFRMIFNLCFVPVGEVKSKFFEISMKVKLLRNDKFLDFLDYFDKNYVGSDSMAARYDIKFWNCYSRVLLNIPRTINCLEAWHRSLNFKCNIAHLNIGKFLEILIMENERVRVSLLQARLSLPTSGKILKKEESLRIICENFMLFSISEYFEILNTVICWKFEN